MEASLRGAKPQLRVEAEAALMRSPHANAGLTGRTVFALGYLETVIGDDGASEHLVHWRYVREYSAGRAAGLREHRP